MHPETSRHDQNTTFASVTAEAFSRQFSGQVLIHQSVRKWAAIKPESEAIVNFERQRRVSWREFDSAVTALARQLVRLGFKRGDYLAASLPFLTEHVFLEYACFDIGVVHVPLDPRLKPPDVIRALGQVRPKAFAFLGPTKTFDFRALAKALQPHCPFIEHWIQFSAREDCLSGSISIAELLTRPATQDIENLHAEMRDQVHPDDGALVIFTSGSTGSPKPALLSHRNITTQNFCLGAAFNFESRVLVNLPPFHIGGQAEELMTTFFQGGAAILLEIFDPVRSLEAIERERVDLIGQIPAMFNLEWRASEGRNFNLSSLRLAVYGGQEVNARFLAQLENMAPLAGTGLGLTEAAGFCTYTPVKPCHELSPSSLGFSTPIYPMTIREPMRDDGSAGEELPPGEIGHVCFRGPQTFLGYVNNPEATSQSISRDGYLYTGDLGRISDDGLHFAGRAKWIIKPAGHQVFPGDVERHLCSLESKVANCGVVGAKHEVFSEAIVAFIEPRPGVEITAAELRKHARSLISYMRPMHYVILEPGQMPLSATAKTDYVALSRMAEAEVERLRAAGKWDR